MAYRDRVAIGSDAASQCLMWARASRRRLCSAMALETDRAGELRLGLIAFDHALNAARWMMLGGAAHAVAGSSTPDAEPSPALDLAAFEEVRERVRGIRNVITHFDDRIATGYLAAVEANADGLTARQRGMTLTLGFLEWDRWLDDLESIAGASRAPQAE